jgi:hypothetical protein
VLRDLQVTGVILRSTWQIPLFIDANLAPTQGRDRQLSWIEAMLSLDSSYRSRAPSPRCQLQHAMPGGILEIWPMDGHVRRSRRNPIRPGFEAQMIGSGISFLIESFKGLGARFL